MKAFADEEMATLRFFKVNQDVFEYGRATSYIRCVFFLSQRILANFGDVAIVLVVRATFVEYELTIGEITAIFLYVRTLMLNATVITNNLQHVAKVYGSSYEIAVLIVTPARVTWDGCKKHDKNPADNESTNVLDGVVSLENVHFSYPKSDKVQVLKGVSMEAKRNQTFAIVGHSGSGKSSIISLIQRFYDPNQGRVLYGGDDIKELDNKWYH